VSVQVVTFCMDYLQCPQYMYADADSLAWGADIDSVLFYFVMLCCLIGVIND